MKNLYAALAAFQAEVDTIPKTANNPFFQSKYAALPDIMAIIQPLLTKHGLVVMQFPSTIYTSDHATPALRTVVAHTSGEQIEDTTPLLMAKEDPQGHGASITYMRRFAMMGILNLIADTDDDGNLASGHTSSTTKPAGGAKRVYQKASEQNSPENAKEYGVPEGHAARNESARVISSNIAKRNLLDAANLILNDEAVAKGVAAGVWQDEAKGLSTVGSSKLDAMIEETKLRAAAINLGAELTD